MLNVRVAKPTDVSTIAHIHAHTWKDAYKFMPDTVLNNRNEAFRRHQWNSWFREKKFSEHERLFVITNHGQPIGFCMCKPNLDSALPDVQGELHAVYVLPEARAYGASLIGAIAMTSFLLEEGLSPICTWAFQKNPIWKWYERQGFQRVIARDRVINGVGVPEFGMVHYQPEALIENCQRKFEQATQRLQQAS